MSNNSLSLFDVPGLFEYDWEGNFTDSEKQAIKDSIGRVGDRAKKLIKQMEDNVKALNPPHNFLLRLDQHTLCSTAPAAGRPFPPLDHACSVPQSARSSRASIRNMPQARRASV